MTEQGTIAIPEATSSVPASSEQDVDAAIAAVAAKRKEWVDLSLDERIDLLDRTVNATLDAADGWVEAVGRLKGLDPGTPRIGEA